VANNRETVVKLGLEKISLLFQFAMTRSSQRKQLTRGPVTKVICRDCIQLDCHMVRKNGRRLLVSLHIEALLIDFLIYLSFYKDPTECGNECPKIIPSGRMTSITPTFC